MPQIDPGEQIKDQSESQGTRYQQLGSYPSQGDPESRESWGVVCNVHSHNFQDFLASHALLEQDFHKLSAGQSSCQRATSAASACLDPPPQILWPAPGASQGPLRGEKPSPIEQRLRHTPSLPIPQDFQLPFLSCRLAICVLFISPCASWSP
jgi:hypothetical protein